MMLLNETATQISLSDITQAVSTLIALGGGVSLILLFALKKRKLAAEVRKAEAEALQEETIAEKGQFQWLKEQVESLKSENQTVTRDLTEAQRQIKNLELEIEKLKSSESEKDKRISQLEKECEAWKAIWDLFNDLYWKL